MQNKRMLYLQGLPDIENNSELSEHIRLSTTKINHLYYNTSKYYKTVLIQKSNGTMRELECPSSDLKAVQRWILTEILDKLRLHKSATAFRKGASILSNAVLHTQSKYLVNMDIESFFTSIPAWRVARVFSSVGYGTTMAGILTRFCTVNDHLPQGAPTSPMLANHVCWRIDRRIDAYTSANGTIYSRYADDISLSSNDRVSVIRARNFVRYLLKEEKFNNNAEKERMAGPSKRRTVTGLVINSNTPRIGKEKKRSFRARIHRFVMSPNEVEKAEQKSIVGYLAFLKNQDRITYHQIYEYSKSLISRHGDKCRERMIMIMPNK